MAGRNSKEPCDECTRPGVLPENREAVDLFLRCSTQWNEQRWEYMDGDKLMVRLARRGMRYEAVWAVLDHLPVEDKADCFERLQLIEQSFIEASNET